MMAPAGLGASYAKDTAGGEKVAGNFIPHLVRARRGALVEAGTSRMADYENNLSALWDSPGLAGLLPVSTYGRD
jgi:hypothetical protein